MTTKIKKINEIDVIDGQDLNIEDYVVGVDFETGEARRITLSQVASLYEETGQFISKLGEPEDGSYQDGLFTDFTEETTLGVAMDRVNEVLKGLAPLAPPILSNLEKSSLGSNNAYLSFGAGNGINYAPVTAIQPPTLSAVGVGGNFANASLPEGGGGAVRLGVYTATTPIVLTLNNKTVEDSAGSIENYPNDCFSVSSDGIGTFILEINGVEYSPSVQTLNTASLNQGAFSLGAATSGHFLASGLEFAYFKNRVGTVTIPTTQWRLGHNYVKVSQVSSLSPTPQTTNYVDWVYDPDAASGTSAFVFNPAPSIQSFSISGQKNLSGIKYYTQASYNLNVSIENYYKNVYNLTGVSVINKTSNLNATVPSIPAPTSPTQLLNLIIPHSINSGRVLDQQLSSTVRADNGLGKIQTSSQINTSKVLFDNQNDSNNQLKELFCVEDYRLQSDIYDTQSSVSSAPAFPSQNALADGNLAVFNGALRHPKQTINGGNIAGSGIAYMIAGQPNYSGFNQNCFYFRKFQNTTGSPLSSFSIKITGTNIGFVESNGSLSNSNIRVWIKNPGFTGWRDCIKGADQQQDDLSDNIGARASNITSVNSTFTIPINMLTKSINNNNYFVIRIETSSGWTGNITKIEI